MFDFLFLYYMKNDICRVENTKELLKKFLYKSIHVRKGHF